MDASNKVTVRVRKKRRKSEGRPAPKGRTAQLAAGVAGILLVALAAVYGMVGPEQAAAVVPEAVSIH
jgi:hypothetical protein